MLYHFTYRSPFPRGFEDECEGSSRGHISMDRQEESIEATSDDDALMKAIKIMQQHQMDFDGKDYVPEAISLVRVLDVSVLRQAKAA